MQEPHADIRVYYSRKRSVPLVDISVEYLSAVTRKTMPCPTDVLFCALCEAFEDKLTCNKVGGGITKEAKFYEDSEENTHIWEWDDVTPENIERFESKGFNGELSKILAKLFGALAEELSGDIERILEMKRGLENVESIA